MIIVYPMLTSQTVSQNAIPGICKVVEKFILTHAQDTIMEIARKEGKKLQYSKSLKGFTMKEGDDFTPEEILNIISENDDFDAELRAEMQAIIQEAKEDDESYENFKKAEEQARKDAEKSAKEAEKLSSEEEKLRVDREQHRNRMNDEARKQREHETRMRQERERIDDLENERNRAQTEDEKRRIEKDLKAADKKLKDAQLKSTEAKEIRDEEAHKAQQRKNKIEEIQKRREAAMKNSDEKRRQADEARRKREDIARRASVTGNIGPVHGDQAALEPTYVDMEVEVGGLRQKRLIGIKVISIPVESDAKLTELIMSDKQMSKFKTSMVSRGRIWKRWLYTKWYQTMGKLPWFKRAGISGDPRKDIVLGKSVFKENVLLCLNLMYFNSSYVTRADIVRKLQKLGWGSYLITDDINKRAYFCMKEFKGMCSVIPYTMIYGSLGREMQQAYQELEDVRKSSSPIFATRRPVGRLLNIREDTAAGKKVIDKINMYSTRDDNDE